MAEVNLDELSGDARKHYTTELRRNVRLTKSLGHRMEKELKSKDPKVGRIHSMVISISILLDKHHELLGRVRDLEHFGDEETEAAFTIIVKEDDGSTHSTGRYVPRETVDTEASASPVDTD